ncbi:hypothetical protein PENTCL1PPCAC_22298, partial [Pristionchus entomophagus]
MDHITDITSSHDTLIRVYDGIGSEIIEMFHVFPVEETMMGTGRISIDIARISDNSHLIEIQISAVKLNCTCGPTESIFNAS